MSWERRARGGRYYTRTMRVRGRRVREYIGTGPAAQLVASLDELMREYRAEDRRQRRRQREAMDSLDTQVAEMDRLVTQVLRAELEAAGFHRHQRGEWRRKRGQANPAVAESE